MGSQSFTVNSRGKSAKEAYQNAVDDAEAEYGHQQGYSGAINATPGFRDVTKQFKAEGLPLYNYIEKRLEELTKFQGAECICLEEPKGNINKIKTQVEHIVTPGTKKWVLKYCVYDRSDRLISSHLTKGDAVKAARAYTEKTEVPTNVLMEKILEKGKPIVATISYKKSSNEKEGKYVFYGWASC
jgi:hypothetical protein